MVLSRLRSGAQRGLVVCAKNRDRLGKDVLQTQPTTTV